MWETAALELITMPLKFSIAHSYLQNQSDETETRVFDPKSSSDTEFKEFMVHMFLSQQATNTELLRIVGEQKETIADLTAKLTEAETANNNAHLHRDGEIETLRQENSTLRTELTLLQDDVSTINTKYEKLYERSLDQERHSRSFNLRIPNQPEQTTREGRQREDCVALVKNKLAEVGLGHVQIENAHRVGPDGSDPTKPRQVIARFLFRPERRQVWLKRKQLWEKDFHIFEDYCKHDLDRKLKYAAQIKAIFDRGGSKVWFSKGFYYVNGIKQTQMV